jgi:hypothetical protein
MAKLLNTEYVFRVEIYLIANNLTVQDFEDKVYLYNIWVSQQGNLFAKENNFPKDRASDMYRHMNEKEQLLFDEWLINKHVKTEQKAEASKV